MKSERPLNHSQIMGNPNPLICLLGGAAYIALASIVYALPTLTESRLVLQLSAIVIGVMALGVNFVLQRIILGDGLWTSKRVVQTLVLDVNRTNRLK